MTNLTPSTEFLFTRIFNMLGDWAGTPPTYDLVTSQTRGNLTDLKKLGLVTTFVSDGFTWIAPTLAGFEKAKEMGIFKPYMQKYVDNTKKNSELTANIIAKLAKQ